MTKLGLSEKIWPDFGHIGGGGPVPARGLGDREEHTPLWPDVLDALSRSPNVLGLTEQLWPDFGHLAREGLYLYVGSGIVIHNGQLRSILEMC
jgi:hypothetical protein